jgi:probable HAF family extracellular repeat protein
MNTLRRLRSLWIPCVATIVLGCFSDAVAQVRYHVEDLGTLEDGFFGCTMGVNNHGWTETQYGLLEGGKLLKGRVAINFDGFTFPIPTLGGPNNWDNPFGGEINDRGEAVGYSETDVLDPNGEDVCGFGTHLTCSAFLWRNGHMSALPTVGGNNGQASAINNRGEVVGFAETANTDPTCPPTPTTLPVLWEKGQAQPLPTVGSDPDGVAFGINDLGQAVGYSGDCFTAKHAVMWQNGTAFPLPDLGVARSNFGFAINNLGQIVGQVRKADGSARVAALWQPDGTLTVLGTLPGEIASQATGINSKGQVVGSTFDSGPNGPNWTGGFIWQNLVMTDLNTLIPADSNLFIINASNINERGQISGMAFVHAGPHAGDIHSILLTPVDESIGTSMADFARTHPHSNLPANVGNQLLQRFGPGRFDQ